MSIEVFLLSICGKLVKRQLTGSQRRELLLLFLYLCLFKSSKQTICNLLNTCLHGTTSLIFNVSYINDTVTNLYRRIFQYLLANGCIDTSTRHVEREVAAALESVFPKFGLKTFWYKNI